jgi:hypothetical protein
MLAAAVAQLFDAGCSLLHLARPDFESGGELIKRLQIANCINVQHIGSSSA